METQFKLEVVRIDQNDMRDSFHIITKDQADKLRKSVAWVNAAKLLPPDYLENISVINFHYPISSKTSMLYCIQSINEDNMPVNPMYLSEGVC